MRYMGELNVKGHPMNDITYMKTPTKFSLHADSYRPTCHIPNASHIGIVCPASV